MLEEALLWASLLLLLESSAEIFKRLRLAVENINVRIDTC